MDIQLKKGILDVCVLQAVSKNETYGYKIISDLHGIVEISESTLYPILRRLEAGGFLITRTVEYNRRLRRYYSITPEGKQKLEAGKRDLMQMQTILKKLFGANI